MLGICKGSSLATPLKAHPLEQLVNFGTLLKPVRCCGPVFPWALLEFAWIAAGLYGCSDAGLLFNAQVTDRPGDGFPKRVTPALQTHLFILLNQYILAPAQFGSASASFLQSSTSYPLRPSDF